MAYFEAETHQIRFPLGLGPRPAGGAYSASHRPLAGFQGPTAKGQQREREGEKSGTKGLLLRDGE